MGMTRKQVHKELLKTGELTTAMLPPLGISFESFLKFAQLDKRASQEIIRKILQKLSGE